VFLSVIVILLYAPVLTRMASQFYKDPSYSHGFLIPFFSGYLIWLKRDQFGRLRKSPTFVGLWIVMGAIALLYLGSMGAELFLTRVSLLIAIFGLVVYFEGRPTLRLLVFPLCFLFLMIPLPAIIYHPMVFPLQLLSSRFATATLEAIKVVPVLREGNLLILPHCTLEVVEACSGIRSLASLVALALGYAYLAERSIGVRAFLTIAMVPIAIVGNGVRVVLAALLAHYKGAQTVDGFLHPISSLIIFLVAVLSLLTLHGAITFLRKLLGSHGSS
jgi:exosortase